MKRFLILLLTAALCLSMAGCGGENPLSAVFQPKVDRDSVLLHHSLSMARTTGAIAENFELISPVPSLMEIAEDFTCLADDAPDKAWIADVGDIGKKFALLNAELGVERMACATSLTHGTLIQMPEELDDRYGVLLRYEDGYSLVVYEPLEGAITTVTAFALYPEIAEEMRDRYFDDAEPYGEDEIEERCEQAKDVSFTAKPAKEEPTAAFYEEKALQVLESVDNARGYPELFTPNPEILEYCELWLDTAGDTPSDVEVWTMDDAVEPIEEYVGGKISDDRMTEFLRQAIGNILIQQVSASYSDLVLASNSTVKSMTDGVCLGPAPEGQADLILVALHYDDEATALVCIYDNGYGLNQYAYGFIPGTLNSDPEDGGFEALD